MRPIRRKGLRGRVLIAAAAVLLLWGAGFVAFAVSLPVEPEDSRAPTDAIVVLTGGSLRLEAGLRLLDAGLGGKLFVSGVHRGIDVTELMRVSRQSPARADCCIVLGYEADNTSGNAHETAEWMAREGFRSIRLVTAGYHMPRSLLEFRRAMPTVELVPHPVFPDQVKTPEWYRYPGTAALIAGEYSKSLLAAVRLGAEWALRKLRPGMGERP